jgi:hypothetical protein
MDTAFFTAVRESMLVYPILLSTHLTNIAVFGGLILMTDLRLLGVVLKGVPAADIIRGTRPWKWVGFLIQVTVGILLGSAKLESYYDNPYFILKLSLLALVGVHALVFHRSVYGDPEKLDALPSMPRVAKIAAVCSLVLWVGILSCGRWIAYYEKPDEKASVSRANHDYAQPDGGASKASFRSDD